MRTRIKICGLTSLEDTLAAMALGVDALGFVLTESPRQLAPRAVLEIVRALPPFVTCVGVVRDIGPDRIETLAQESGVSMIQIHSEEPVDYGSRLTLPWIQRFRIPMDGGSEALRSVVGRSPANAFLIDPGAGTGVPFDWSLARGLPTPTFIAGGLDSANVARAILAARPFGVDVASGVESAPGKKDVAQMENFVTSVRGADDAIGP